MKRLAVLFCTALLAACGANQDNSGKTEITLMRFFGSCEAQYGQVVKASEGVGARRADEPGEPSVPRRGDRHVGRTAPEELLERVHLVERDSLLKRVEVDPDPAGHRHRPSRHVLRAGRLRRPRLHG